MAANISGILEQFLKWLSKERAQNAFLEPRVEAALVYLNQQFPEFHEQSQQVLENMVTFAPKNPDRTIEIGRSLIEGIQNLNPFLILADRKFVSPSERLERLAAYWESASIIRTAILFLDSYRSQTSLPTKPEAIFKHFKGFGLSNKDRENFRLLRNAKNHKFGVWANSLIYW